MRGLILTALLATSAAMPAMAQDRAGFGGRDEDRAGVQQERAEPRAERHQRRERIERQQVADQANWSERGEERQRAVEQQEVRQPAFQQPDLRREGERRSWEQRRAERAEALQQRIAPAAQEDSLERHRYTRVRDGSGSGDSSGVRRWRGQRDVPTATATGEVTSRHRLATTPWSDSWRRDRSYDWRRHREGHRSLYRLGRYRDPYGSRYRRFSIGFSLFPSYYGSSYWLDDPWMYRLPRAYGPYRWVRYYGDALLVNVYTGRVVDVVHDFFW